MLQRRIVLFFWRSFFELVLLATSTLTATYAAVPVLEWDPNPEPSVIGYNVYVGRATREYSEVIDVGPQTSVSLTNLNQGITYFLAVTAYDENHLESPFSDEVSYTSPIDGITSAVLPCILTSSNSSTTVLFNPRAGQLCRVAASSDLRQWEEVFTAAGMESSIQYIDDSAPDRPMRFYRVIVTPP